MILIRVHFRHILSCMSWILGGIKMSPLFCCILKATNSTGCRKVAFFLLTFLTTGTLVNFCFILWIFGSSVSSIHCCIQIQGKNDQVLSKLSRDTKERAVSCVQLFSFIIVIGTESQPLIGVKKQSIEPNIASFPLWLKLTFTIHAIKAITRVFLC